MDWNYILLLLTAFGCGSLVWRSVRPGRPMIFGWGAVGAFVLGLTAAVWTRRPSLAGFVGFTAWSILGLIPPLLMQQARRMFQQHRLGLAYRLAIPAAL